MRTSVIVLIGILAVSVVGATIYVDSLLRGVSTVQAADILSHPSVFNGTRVELRGRLEPWGSEPSQPWRASPSPYGVLRDSTGALILSFPAGAPARYLYGELTVKGRVQYQPEHAPELWLYLEVSSYQGSEITLKAELHRTGGIAGANDLLLIDRDGAGRYSRGFGGDKAFRLSTDELYRLKALIVGNDFQAVTPETYGAKPGAADYFVYSLTVTYYTEGQETGNKTVSWVDDWALKEPLPENLDRIRRGLEALVAELVKDGTVSGEEAARLAVSVVKSSATFKFDGLEEGFEVTDVTRVVNEPPAPGYFWVVVVTYSTGHPGHGDRSGRILPQVVTRHRAVVTLDEFGGVTGATCDDVWDLLAQIPSPPVRPTRFIAVVNEARKLDVYVDVDITDGVTQAEAKLIAETTFTAAMGEKALHRLDNLTQDGDLIKAHFSWGYSLQDLGHVFDMTVDLRSRSIIVTHCR